MLKYPSNKIKRVDNIFIQTKFLPIKQTFFSQNLPFSVETSRPTSKDTVFTLKVCIIDLKWKFLNLFVILILFILVVVDDNLIIKCAQTGWPDVLLTHGF